VLVDDVPVMQRLPNFSIEQIMVVVNSPSRELCHSRAAQELIEEGRQLTRRCGSWRPWGWPCWISAAPRI
jgi:hypothetical protein